MHIGWNLAHNNAVKVMQHLYRGCGYHHKHICESCELDDHK